MGDPYPLAIFNLQDLSFQTPDFASVTRLPRSKTGVRTGTAFGSLDGGGVPLDNWPRVEEIQYRFTGCRRPCSSRLANAACGLRGCFQRQPDTELHGRRESREPW